MAGWTYIVGVLILAGVYAGSYTTPEGMQVTWNVTSPTVTFSLYMPSSLAASYAWWGIGVKETGGRQDMKDSLLWMVTKSGTFYDVWSTNNDDPPQTTKGAAQLLSHNSQNGYTSVITRNLAASGSSDIALASGGSYMLTYGYGPMSGSTLLKHPKDGASTITLSNEYVATEPTTSAIPSVVLGLGSIALLSLALH